MGYNFGAIYVKVKKGVEQDAVIDSVTKYWEGAGARRDDKNLDQLEPLGLDLKGTEKLGYSISPVEEEWIGLFDSERYSASQELAKDLSNSLKTMVIHFEISDTTDEAEISEFQNGELKLQDFGYSDVIDKIDEAKVPFFGVYYDDFSKKDIENPKEGFKFFGFDKVDLEKYYKNSEKTDEEIQKEQIKIDKLTEETIKKGDLVFAEFKKFSIEYKFSIDLENEFEEIWGSLPPYTEGYGSFVNYIQDLFLEKEYEKIVELFEYVLEQNNIFADNTFGFISDNYLGSLIKLKETKRAGKFLSKTLIEDPIDSNLIFLIADYFKILEKDKESKLLKSFANKYSEGKEMRDVFYDDCATIYLDFVKDEKLESLSLDNLENILHNYEAIFNKSRVLDKFIKKVRSLKEEREKVYIGFINVLKLKDKNEIAKKLKKVKVEDLGYQEQRDIWKYIELEDDELEYEIYKKLIGCKYVDSEIVNNFVVRLYNLNKIDEAKKLNDFILKHARKFSWIYHSYACIAIKFDKELALKLIKKAYDNYYPFIDRMEADVDLQKLWDHSKWVKIREEFRNKPIRVYEDNDIPNKYKKLIVRDVVHASLKFPGNHLKNINKISEILKKFLAFTPANEFKWYRFGVNTTKLKDFDKKGLKKIRTALDKNHKNSKKDHIFFEFLGPEISNPGFHFEYSSRIYDNFMEIQMRFPYEWVDELGFDTFLDWIFEAVGGSNLKGNSYITGLITEGPNYWGTESKELGDVSYIYQGLDVDLRRTHLSSANIYGEPGKDIEFEFVENTKWIEILDQKQIEKLGGIENVKSKLGRLISKEFNNNLWIQAGNKPYRGFYDNLENKQQLRKMTKLLEPISKYEHMYDESDQVYYQIPKNKNWHRRFLD